MSSSLHPRTRRPLFFRLVPKIILQLRLQLLVRNLRNSQFNMNLGTSTRFSKVRKTFGPEKPFVKLDPLILYSWSFYTL